MNTTTIDTKDNKARHDSPPEKKQKTEATDEPKLSKTGRIISRIVEDIQFVKSVSESNIKNQETSTSSVRSIHLSSSL